jgi:hypothetical protein
MEMKRFLEKHRYCRNKVELHKRQIEHYKLLYIMSDTKERGNYSCITHIKNCVLWNEDRDPMVQDDLELVISLVCWFAKVHGSHIELQQDRDELEALRACCEQYNYNTVPDRWTKEVKLKSLQVASDKTMYADASTILKYLLNSPRVKISKEFQLDRMVV